MSGTEEPIRVAVVDDQELVRAGLIMILDSDPGLSVVGEARNGHEAISVVERERPDVVLMDIRMPEMDGIEATGRILERRPETRILILTTFDLDEYVFDALRAGAAGFLLKDAPTEQLVDGVRVLAAGDALLAPSITSRLVAEFATRRPRPDRSRQLDDLTDRETEVLLAVARGLSNAEIGEALFVSETTIKTHVGRVLTKLGVRDRVQAVVLAYESGLVTPGDQVPMPPDRGPGTR